MLLDLKLYPENLEISAWASLVSAIQISSIKWMMTLTSFDERRDNLSRKTKFPSIDSGLWLCLCSVYNVHFAISLIKPLFESRSRVSIVNAD